MNHGLDTGAVRAMTAYDKATADRLCCEARSAAVILDSPESTLVYGSKIWLRNNLAAIADHLEAAGRELEIARGTIDSGNEAFRVVRTAWATERETLRAEVERLTGCMNTAGLQCFIRGGSPEQVSAHMRSVAESWIANEAKLTAEREALRVERDDARRVAAEVVGDGVVLRWEELIRSQRMQSELIGKLVTERDTARARVAELEGSKP